MTCITALSDTQAELLVGGYSRFPSFSPLRGASFGNVNVSVAVGSGAQSIAQQALVSAGRGDVEDDVEIKQIANNTSGYRRSRGWGGYGYGG